MEEAANELLKNALKNTADEYAANTDGQGKDLAKGTKALIGAASSTAEVAAGAINMMLDPFRLTIYGYGRLKEKLIPKVQQYLSLIPEENIVSPDEAIAGPILEAAKFKTNDDISDLFAALLASAMDVRSKDSLHPAYVQIVNEMSADEAKMLQYLATHRMDSYPVIDLHAKIKGEIGKSLVLGNFTDLGYKASCIHLSLVPSYIDNLARLKLIELPFGSSLSDKAKYTPLKEHIDLNQYKESIAKWEREVYMEERALKITPFGYGFMHATKLTANS